MDLSTLKANPKNPRKVTDKKLKALIKSMNEFGDLGGVIFNRQTQQLIGGHQRISAFKKLGFKQIEMTDATNGFVLLENGDKFAYREVDWDENREKAANIAANKGAGEWDMPQLAEWFAELKELDFDLDLTMFDEDERKQFFKDAEQVEGLTDPDEIPENVETRCKPGDLWLLGNHRLLCGDSTKVQHVERLMGGEKADMVFTDPPYGIDYQGGSKKREKIENDSIPVLQFYRDFLSLAKTVSKSGASIYIWHASTETHNCINAAIESGWQYKQYIIWNKNNSTFGRQDYHWKHEPCFYGWGADGSHKWYGDRKQTTVWDIERPSKSEEHPTMKPVDLCVMAIKNSSDNNHKIYEPFCGSGSTLIACEKTKRECYGMELNPKYCDVILERWEKFTGKTATLQTGEDQADE